MRYVPARGASGLSRPKIVDGRMSHSSDLPSCGHGNWYAQRSIRVEDNNADLSLHGLAIQATRHETLIEQVDTKRRGEI